MIKQGALDLRNRVRRRRFADLMKRAAFLHREFIGVKQSNDFRVGVAAKDHRGGIVLHVYDTTIVRAYTAPWNSGPLTGSGGNGFGQLLPRQYQFPDISGFSSDEREELRAQFHREDRLAINIVSLLTRTAINRPEDPSLGGPLYQFKGHLEETERRIAELKNLSTSPNTSLDGFRVKLHLYSKLLLQAVKKKTENFSKNWNIEIVLERFLEVILERKIVIEFGTVFENAAMQDLIEKRPPKCLTVKELSDIGYPALNSFGGFDHEENEKFAHRVLVSVWKDFLSGDRESTSQADAEALADLAIINQRLFRAGRECRVVFVTGDRRIVEKAYNIYEYMKENQGFYVDRLFGEIDRAGRGKIKDSLRGYFQFDTNGKQNWFRRFSLNYIRHLHAYARESFIESKRTLPFDDIFSGLFAKDSESILLSPVRLADLALQPDLRAIPDDFRDKYYKVLSKWEELANVAVKSRSFDSSSWFDQDTRRNFISSLTGPLEELGFDSSKHSEELEKHIAAWMMEYVDRTRDRVMLQLSNIGTELLIDADQGFAVRHPPDLHFLTLDNTQHLFKELADVGGYSALQADPEKARAKFGSEFDKT
jgi:hypothetical protein